MPLTKGLPTVPQCPTAHDRHKIGIPAGIAYTVGHIIGSGIFFTPAIIVRHAGSIGLSLIVWALGGVVALLGSLVYIELGTSIPKSGASFTYLYHAGWRAPATSLIILHSAFQWPCATAISALTLGEYVLEGLSTWFCVPDEWDLMLRRLIGFSVVLLLMFINMFSLKFFAGRFQIIATVVKVAVIAAITATGLYYLVFRDGAKAFREPFAGSNYNIPSLYTAIIPALFAYSGWNVLSNGLEDVRHPARTLPIIFLTGLLAAAAIFLLVNIAYFGVLSVDEVAGTPAVAYTFAAKAVPGSQHFIPFLVGLLLVSNQNCMLFMTSRSILAGAKKGVFPSLFTCVHPGTMSPRPALFYDAAFAFLYSFFGDLDELIGYTGSISWGFDCLTGLALIYMRWREFPFPKDAYRNPLIVPVLFTILSASLAIMPVVNRPAVGIASLTMIVLALGAYYALIRPSRTPATIARINELAVHITQIVLNTVPTTDV